MNNPLIRTFAKNEPLTQKILVPGLAAVIFFQTLVLVMVLGNALMPLWTGQDIRLNTRPVDPRSLFRGNYARLNFDISRISAKEVTPLKSPRQNEIIYVSLKKGKNGIYGYQNASFTPPEQGIFIRGRIINRHPETTGTYQVRFGIEAYFAPKEKALELEKQLRNKAVALVSISKGGKAALKEIHPPKS